MKPLSSISTDLVLSPFGASASEILEAAKCAEESGFDGIWMLDHFSGVIADKKWSHETFTILGAIAAITETVKLGSLVANMMNRSPVILASAFSSLQGISEGRATLGLGTGAPPGTLFALEQEMVGRELDEGKRRHRRLIETIQSLRCIWSGEKNFEGEFISFRNLEAVVEPNSSLPIVVGANGLEMIQLASEYADGVNIRVGPSTEKMIRRAVALAPSNEFEISVHENLDLSHPLGGEIDKWLELGVRRRACMISTPFDLETVSQIGAHLQKI